MKAPEKACRSPARTNAVRRLRARNLERQAAAAALHADEWAGGRAHAGETDFATTAETPAFAPAPRPTQVLDQATHALPPLPDGEGAQVAPWFSGGFKEFRERWIEVGERARVPKAPHGAHAALERRRREGGRPRADVPLPAPQQARRVSWRGGPTIFAPLDCSAGEVVPWNELWRDSELIDLGDDVRIASIPHLIQLERLADRPEDRVDIEALTAILEAKAPR